MSPQAGGPTAKPAFTVAEVLRVGLPDYARGQAMPPQHWRVLRAIMVCRTPELGVRDEHLRPRERLHKIPLTARGQKPCGEGQQKGKVTAHERTQYASVEKANDGCVFGSI